jgi:hypothetical protein
MQELETMCIASRLITNQKLLRDDEEGVKKPIAGGAGAAASASVNT